MVINLFPLHFPCLSSLDPCCCSALPFHTHVSRVCVFLLTLGKNPHLLFGWLLKGWPHGCPRQVSLDLASGPRSGTQLCEGSGRVHVGTTNSAFGLLPSLLFPVAMEARDALGLREHIHGWHGRVGE